MEEPKTLSYIEKMKYRRAIHQGYFEGYDKDPIAWKHTFAGAFVWKNPTRIKVLDLFKGLLGHTPTWEDITDINLEEFSDELKKHYTANTLKNRFAEVKAVVNRHRFEVDIPSHRFVDILKAKEEPSQSVFLTEEEVNRIYKFQPRSNVQRYVRRIFLIEAYTGARNCDSVRLSRDNCDMKTDTISYVSQKTKTRVILPVHRNLMELLNDRVDYSTWHITLVEFNDTLKQICELCGINDKRLLYRRGEEQIGPKWKFVSSHTGRRSFATNLYLRGADPTTIARLMGHSSPEITVKRYIVAFRDLNDSVLDFFHKP